MTKITVNAVVLGVASLAFAIATTTAHDARFFRITGPVPTTITNGYTFLSVGSGNGEHHPVLSTGSRRSGLIPFMKLEP